MGFWDNLAVVLVIVTATAFLAFVFQRLFAFKEKQLDVNARVAAERAAAYAVSNQELEQRVRVLEQIVTDRGVDTAAQIEALRTPKLAAGARRDI